MFSTKTPRIKLEANYFNYEKKSIKISDIEKIRILNHKSGFL